MTLQAKNKFEGLSDIILGVMGQVPVPFSVEESHRQADITSPSMFEGDPEIVRWSGMWHFPTRFLGCRYSRGGQGSD